MQDVTSFLTVEKRDGVLVDLTRKKLWKTEIEILKIIDEICDKHDLNYFLAGGALIGAIRHNGFIPWDDDIDICMLRKDYDKFLTVADKELPHYYFLQNGINEEGYFDTITRVRDSRTTGILYKDLDKNCNNGIFVEIYPLDAVVSDKKKYKGQIKKISFYKALLHLQAYGLDNNASKKDKILFAISKLYFKFTSPKLIFEKMQKCCKKYNGNKCEYVDELMTKYNCKYRYCDVCETILHDFEYTKFKIPIGYDLCLKTTYGEYMKKPPLEERLQHHEKIVYYDPNRSYKDKEVQKKAREHFNTKGE